MKRPFLLYLFAASLFLSAFPAKPGAPLPGPRESVAAEDWKGEFDAVCSKTDVAMTLSVGELKELIGRCVQLKDRIEAQDESMRKVYLRRLKMCRDLYDYVLESKEKGK